MPTTTPNMSIYIPDSGEQSFFEAFKAGMQKVDAHDHSGAPENGVQIGTSGIQDGAITTAKLADSIQDEETVSTTDATATQIATIPLTTKQVVEVWGHYVGFKDTGAVVIGGSFEGTFYRNTGNVTVVSAPTVNARTTFSTAEFTLVADTSAQAVDLKVTGEGSTNIKWTVRYWYVIQGTT